ncbi:hypothetical protein ACFXA3_21680 [Streptomyces sp. NPDC059456]
MGTRTGVAPTNRPVRIEANPGLSPGTALLRMVRPDGLRTE